MSFRSLLFERLTTFYLDLDVHAPLEHEFEGLELVRPSIADLYRLRLAEPEEFSANKMSVLEDRLATDAEVWLVRERAGDWAGWCHMAWGRGPNSRINHTLRMLPNEVYLFDDHTLVRFRRQGIHGFTVHERLAGARKRGAVRAITTITRGNSASVESFLKIGFRPRSQLLYIRPLRRSIEVPLNPAWTSWIGARPSAGIGSLQRGKGAKSGEAAE